MKSTYRFVKAVVALTIFPVSTATVHGDDYCYETNNGTITILSYLGSSSSVTIPNEIDGLPVRCLGDDAFAGRSCLTDVIIPNSVTIIGNRAFCGCTNLTSILIPNSVTTISDAAFGGTGLTSVTIPNSVTEIMPSVFYGCFRLINITLPESVTIIGGAAFAYCTSLTNVVIPHSVTEIRTGVWGGAFMGCTGLKSIIIPETVTTIDSIAFSHCTNLIEVYFQGNSPTSVGSDVFAQSTNVTVYYLPGTLGWGPLFGDRPTVPWGLPYPLILTTLPNFGFQNNAFGFRISWATNVPIVVEASTSPIDGVWSPVSTNRLTDGWCDFSHTDWTNYPAQFYRIRSL